MIENSEPPFNDPGTPHRRLFSISVFVGLFLLSVLAIYPGYLLWKQHHLVSLTRQAQEFLEREQWEQAYQVLVQAYNQSPTDPVVLQKIARLTHRTNPDPTRALFFWKQLIACGTPTMEDWAEIGKTYLEDSKPEEVVKILASFSPEQKADRYSTYLQSQLLYFKGKTIEAGDLYRHFLLTSPRDPESELNLAILDLDNPFSEVQQRSFETLWRIARSNTRQSALALQTIAQSPLLTPRTSAELVELALNNKGVTLKKYYEILHRHLVLDPKKSPDVYAAEINRHRDKSIQESAALYHWLLQEQQYDRVLELVPKENATRNEILFPIYIEALSGKSRWTELSDLLHKSPSLPLSPIDQSVLQARIAHGTNQPGEIVSGHLKEAGRRAVTTKNLEAIQKIVTIADELRFDDVTTDVLSKASAIPQYQVEMLERLLAIHTRHGDAESMLTVLQTLLEINPAMRSHLEMSLYLKLLLGKEMESVSKHASVLATQGRISTQAYSFLNSITAYRFQDLNQLKILLSQVTPANLPAGQRAVYAGMLASCGEQAQAYIIAEKIAPVLLLQGEVPFLRKAL
ncbi:hypothetical protein BH11VER1_BH11VER1_13240 [soil metagenome]